MLFGKLIRLSAFAGGSIRRLPDKTVLKHVAGKIHFFNRLMLFDELIRLSAFAGGSIRRLPDKTVLKHLAGTIGFLQPASAGFAWQPRGFNPR